MKINLVGVTGEQIGPGLTQFDVMWFLAMLVAKIQRQSEDLSFTFTTCTPADVPDVVRVLINGYFDISVTERLEAPANHVAQSLEQAMTMAEHQIEYWLRVRDKLERQSSGDRIPPPELDDDSTLTIQAERRGS